MKDFNGGSPMGLSPLFQGGPTNTGIVRKETGYSNPGQGITEPQRRIIKALASGKANYLIETENIKGRKRFRCHDAHKNIVGQNFKPVVVRHLVEKGYLKPVGKKLYLK